MNSFVALLYTRCFSYAFVYDDLNQIVANPRLRAWHFLPSYFTEQLWAHLLGSQRGNYYRPLFLIWLRLNEWVFGLNPAGWHITTVALHLVAASVAYRLWKRFCEPGGAWLAAAIFLLHPLQVESVAWISASDETLAAIFILGAYYLFMRAPHPGRRGVAASLALFLLALLTKETATIVPFTIATYVFVFSDTSAALLRRLRASFLSAMPFLLVLGAYLAGRSWVLGRVLHANLRMSPATIALTLPSVSWEYIRHLVVPFPLAVFYSVPTVNRFESLRFWLPLLATALLLAVLYWISRRDRRAMFFLLWILLHLTIPLLTIGLFRNQDFVHDRYWYLPMFGVAGLVGLGWVQARQRAPHLAMGVAGGVLVLLALLSFRQLATWENNEALYRNAYRVSPTALLAEVNLGSELVRQRHLDEAAPLLQRALQNFPDSESALVSLSVVRREQGNLADAIALLQRALALAPDNPEFHFLLGQCWLQSHQTADAITEFEFAAANAPTVLEYHLTLANTYALAGRVADAISEYERALPLTAAAGDQAALRMRIAVLKAQRTAEPGVK